MPDVSIIVHGGAGSLSDYIEQHADAYHHGLEQAVHAGYELLKKGKHALDAVEAAVKSLEDNPYFNAGRGSALNHKGEVEMDASIMDGSTLKSGAVSMLKNVKNPVSLARIILENTSYVFFSGKEALELAEKEDIHLEPDSYFITEHQVDELIKERDNDKLQDLLKKKLHGTVGAVVLDKKGNLAAATSTGGTVNALAGRIGDSCIIGSGCYANSKSAFSATGDGEILINRIITHTVSMVMELTGCTIQQACDYVIHERNKDITGDLGIVGLDNTGNIAYSFNCDRMHRGWKVGDKDLATYIGR